jgi:hypothetical protein
VVYAPVVETPEDPGVQRLKGHVMADGRTALFVYSAIDRLVSLYGDNVPWVLVTVESLQAAFEEVPFDLVFLDQALHPAEGHTEEPAR